MDHILVTLGSSDKWTTIEPHHGGGGHVQVLVDPSCVEHLKVKRHLSLAESGRYIDRWFLFVFIVQ
jgi:hypothetical protein